MSSNGHLPELDRTAAPRSDTSRSSRVGGDLAAAERAATDLLPSTDALRSPPFRKMFREWDRLASNHRTVTRDSDR